MTGLKNRLSYVQYMADEANIKRKQHIIVIDINGLKQVNDQFGHNAGDKLIIDFSKVIKAIIKQYNTINVFRIGGDEFIFFVDTVIGKTGQQIVDEINALCLASDCQNPFKLSFSAGAVYYDPAHNKSLKESVSEADLIMYKHKKMQKSEVAYES